MAVANPCLLKEWAEWKTEVEEGRRKRRKWRKWVSRWGKVERSDEEEEDAVEGESEDTDSDELDVSGEEEENEEEESGLKKRLKGKKEGDEEEDGEMTEADERVDVEEEEEHGAAGKGEEEEEGERDLKKGLKGRKEEEEENEVEGENKGVDEGEEEEGKDEVEREVTEKEEEVKEAKETEEEEEEGESDQESMRGGEEEEEGGMSEARGEKENEVEREVKEVKEEGGEGGSEGKLEGEEVRQAREEKQIREEEDEEEELQEQEEHGRYHLEEQFREEMRRIQAESVQFHQEGTAQEDEDEEDDFSDLTGSEHERYNLERVQVEDRYAEGRYEEPDELEDPDEESWSHESGIFGASWTTQERKEEEDQSEKLTHEEEKVTASRATQEFQDDLENLQEEESTDDEAAEHSPDEDGDSYDDEEEKIYCKDDYPADVFLNLNEFRNSSLLTDLTLSTEDGKTFHVHSVVLAAVSSLIWKHLSRRRVENNRGDEDDTSAGVHRWSVSLGPEVDRVGLEAVIEFAYTGLISRLNEDNSDQIRAAAQTLDAPRVLNLCIEEEEKSAKPGGQKKEGTSAAQQLRISLQSIKQLWMDRVGCDVTLEALGASFHAHRVILAVSSDYFRGMFTLGMKESHQPCVTLPFLLASELEALIGCSYSGALPLSWRCAFELTSTALQLQYQPVFSLCLDFLQQEINPHSCLDVVSFAEAYEMTQLLEVADDFVMRQFQKVACTSKFKDLPARQLLKYLNSRSLYVPSELVLFKAVVAWIQARPKRRLRLAKILMKTIHFPLMTYKEFKEVRSQNMWSDHSLAELYEAIFEDFCSNETALQNQCRIYQPKESLVLIGGDQTSEDLGSRSISRDLWFGNSLMSHAGIKKAMEWRRLGEIPESARFSHEVAVLKGQLYVFGGKMYYGIGDTLNSVYRYDPLKNSWERLAEMHKKRCYFSVVVLDGKIYAIGGHGDPDYIDSVEQYCPTTNCWSYTWPLDLPLGGHVAKVLHGQIFVSGGRNRDYLCLASMLRYHPETGSTYLANMAKPRANHCMEVLGGCLYVAGGITTNDATMTIADQLTCEMYSPAADSWTAFTSLPVPHVGAGSAVLEGRFYVLGGYSQEDCSDTKMVHRYDTTTQRWENMGKMPGPNNDIRASLLCLPQHFRS